MKRLSRQFRDLMVPRTNSLLLAQADAARDRRDWSEAAKLYRQFIALQPERNGLLMQVGHCLKETGHYGAAVAEHLAVTEEQEKAEADFQAGEVLKLAGNPAAAKWIFTRSAARGHEPAIAELDRLSRGDLAVQMSWFQSATETGENENRMLSRLFAVECAPLDWRRLGGAAEDAAIRGFDEPAMMFADLALIVGGTVADRQLPYQTIFGASGLWRGHYAETLASPAFAAMQPADALKYLIDALDFTVEAPAARNGIAGEIAQNDLICIIDANDTDHQIRLKTLATAVTAVRDRLFASDGQDAAGLTAAIKALAQEVAAGKRRIYAVLPEEGRYKLRDIVHRVCLNIATTIAERLAAPLETVLAAPDAVLASFALPTAKATLATCASADAVPSAIDIDEYDDDPGTRQKLSELIALGLLPDSRQSAHDRLLKLADEGRRAPMNYWFSTIAPTTTPRLVGEVAIRVANALKARGALTDALRWTERAFAAMPDRYGMDLGILRKTTGDFAGAAVAFTAVLDRDAAHESAARELNSVVRECMSADAIANLAAEHPGFGAVYRAAEEHAQRHRAEAEKGSSSGSLTAVLDIADLRDTFDFGTARLERYQIGWLQTEVAGRTFARLVGVVAIRMCHITRDPPLRMRLRIDGRTMDVVEPSLSGIDTHGSGKYFFNSWIDTRDLPRGPVRLEVYVEQKSSGYTTYEETVIIDDLKAGEDYAASDAFVPSPDPADGNATALDRVLALPAQSRDAARSALNKTIERVVIMRLDQLGDLSASMPAIRRLRVMFPQARFEGLVTPVNAYLLKASGLFDDIFTVDFTYDHGTRRRWLGRAAHAALKKRYAEEVDIAIDLSPGDDSRPILTLINARYRAGFKPHRFGFLDFGIDLLTRDPVNRKEAVSHTAMISAFVEALATMLRPPPARFPPTLELVRYLEPLKLRPQEYVAIHAGARLAIKRWPLPHYIALAKLLRAETGRDIVMFSDDPLSDEQTAEVEAIGGIQILVGRTAFETLDAVISYAAVFIGNDTGPKHLAAMRGVKTVSVHMGQVNWNEWGQDGEGLIVSKRVPCCGCGIEDPTECGKAMACLDGLKPREIADSVKRTLQG